MSGFPSNQTSSPPGKRSPGGVLTQNHQPNQNRAGTNKSPARINQFKTHIMIHKLFILLILCTILFTAFVVFLHKLPYLLGLAAIVGLIKLYRAYREAASVPQ